MKKLQEHLYSYFPTPDVQLFWARLFNNEYGFDLDDKVFRKLENNIPKIDSQKNPNAVVVLELTTHHPDLILIILSSIINQLQPKRYFNLNLLSLSLKGDYGNTRGAFWRVVDLNPERVEITVAMCEAKHKIANLVFLWAMIYHPTLIKDIHNLGYTNGVWLGGLRTKDDKIAVLVNGLSGLEINPGNPLACGSKRCIPILVE